MKRMRILSAVLAAVMMLSLFAGCAKRDADEQPQSAGVSAGDVTAAPSSAPTTHPADVSPNSTPEMPNKFAEIKDTDDNGYKLIDEYGRQMYRIVLNAEFGGYETATGLYYCRALKYNFEFSDRPSPEATDIEELNCVGVMNAEGHVIVPAKYAAVVELNERYIRAYKVEGEMENEEDALLKLSAADGQKYYKGNWYVFDVLDASWPVADGTEPYQVTADGGDLTYYDDDGSEQHISSIQDRRQITENTYILENEKAGLLYTENGRFVRMFSREGFYLMDDTITDGRKTYLIAEKMNEETGSEYVLMTENGKIASAILPDKPNRIADVVIYLENGSEVFFDGKQSEAASGDVVS